MPRAAPGGAAGMPDYIAGQKVFLDHNVAMGYTRYYIKCPRHEGGCRKYKVSTFGVARLVAFFELWVAAAAEHDTRDGHVRFTPSHTAVDERVAAAS